MGRQGNILYPDMISGSKVTWRDKILSVWNRIPFWIPLVSAVVIICTVFIVRNVKQINNCSDASMQIRTLLPEEEYLLEGIYYVRSLGVEGSGIYSSAEIIGSDGAYNVTVYSDYSPLTLVAMLASDGILRCNGLGKGTVTYKPSTGSVNIVFTKEGTDICEFSK